METSGCGLPDGSDPILRMTDLHKRTTILTYDYACDHLTKSIVIDVQNSVYKIMEENPERTNFRFLGWSAPPYQIASSTALNVVVYNIPSNVGTKIEPETVARLAQTENIKAYKDSTADWENFQRCLFLLKDADISIFNGAEELCAAAMLFGANGCVPGLGCIFQKFLLICTTLHRKVISNLHSSSKNMYG